MSYELTWEQCGVVKRFYGYVTVDEIARASIEVEASKRFDDMRYVINDFLAFTEYVNDVEVIDEVAARDGAAGVCNRNIPVAVVTTMQGLIDAAEQSVKTQMHPYPTRLFATLADARRWVA